MSKTAVIYWSSTGNTEAMAKEVAEGCRDGTFHRIGFFSGSIEDYDTVAFGCPAMGAEVLEEDEFEPFFASVEDKLKGKKIALFGSYGWGGGEWMRIWEERVVNNGAIFVNGEGVTANEAPSEDDLKNAGSWANLLRDNYIFFAQSYLMLTSKTV